MSDKHLISVGRRCVASSCCVAVDRPVSVVSSFYLSITPSKDNTSFAKHILALISDIIVSRVHFVDATGHISRVLEAFVLFKKTLAGLYCEHSHSLKLKVC